ncbi:MAG: DUF285 domain-containing protein [Clostridia bacterium]|nr:DUF285 domain-containing protein [Clostridia bacterium]
MINLNEFLVNKRIDKKIDQPQYKYHPKTKDKLKKYINKLLEQNIHNFNCIDTSNIKDMSELFHALYGVNIRDINNIDISLWDVSNVTNMRNMFNGNANFNCDISNWDVSNVENMSHMFEGCWNFNHPIVKWNVSKVTNMSHMFNCCINFNKPLDKWNVSRVRDMNHMFNGCEKFNQDLNSWNVRRVIDMKYMFDNCTVLKNKPIWYIYK